MKPLSSLYDRIGTLVFPEVRDRPLDAAVHRAFIATRLALTLSALGLAPLCFAAGEPPVWLAAALAWLCLPAAAVAVVSRSGDLRLGEALSLLTWLGLAPTLALGTGAATGLALLLVVPVETAALVALPATPGLAAGAALAGALATGLAVRHGPIGSPLLASLVVTAALAYATLVAVTLRARGREQRRALAAAGRRAALLAEMAEDLELTLDASGAARRVGPAAARLFALEPGDLAGRGLLERLHVADRPAYLKLVSDAAATGVQVAALLRLRSGRRVAADGRLDPVYLPVDMRLRQAGAPGELLALMRDASERVEAERRLADARGEAARALAGRALFLASVTHELRTPLNAIIGFAEMLAGEGVTVQSTEKRREYASIVHQSGQHLLAVVNGILDATKLESGQFALTPETFDLAALVGACCDMVSLKAETSGLVLLRAIAPDLAPFTGDARACRQILLNLLSNALKFTPTGGEVTVTVRRDGHAVLIAVADTGVGIAAADLPRLGDPFFQARGDYARPTDGTGLGLSVVRGLVGLHGGTIRIESAPGEGTRVLVRLPTDGLRPALEPMTKIETIPRYSGPLRHGVAPGGGRINRRA